MEAKVVLITGGSSGIGEATAHLFAEKGFKVAVHGSIQEKTEKVAAECTKRSPNHLQALSIVLDFSTDDNGELAVKKTVEHFGRLDVLVNNAGVFLMSDLEDLQNYEKYKRVMNINTNSTVRATLSSIEHLKKTKGSIVFVSSVASFMPATKGFAYCMSKSAMTMFAKCLAVELSMDIKVNTVSPGPIFTPIFGRAGIPIDILKDKFDSTTLLNRMGTADEVAKTIFFLASDDSKFIVGHELVIDGGYSLQSHSTELHNIKK